MRWPGLAWTSRTPPTVSNKVGHGSGVVQSAVLAFGGHVVECFAAVGAGAFLVVDEVSQQYSTMSATHDLRNLAIGEQTHQRQPGDLEKRPS